MRRLKRKAGASALDKTPENTAAETAVIPVNPEVVMDMVVYQIDHDNDTTNTKKELQDDIVVPTDGVNVFKQNASEEEMNKGIVTVGGEAGDEDGDFDPDYNVYFASGVHDIAASDDEDGGGGNNEDEESEDEDEVEDVDHDYDQNELENENQEEDPDYNVYFASGVHNIAASDDEDGGEGNNEDDGQDEESEDEDEAEDVDHDQNELENDNQEEDNELENRNHEEDNVEDVKPENDEGGHVNTGKEEVKEDNPKKVGIKSQRGRLRKKFSASVDMNGEKRNAGGASGQADIITEHNGGQNDADVGIKSQRGRLRKKISASVDMNGEKRNAGGASGQAHIITEHKGGQSDAGVVIGEADGGKAKEKIEEVGGESSNPKLNKLRKDSRVKAAEGGAINGEKKNAGGPSGQAHIIAEHKGGQSDAGVIIGEADGGQKAKEMIEEVGGESSNPKLNKLRKDSRVKAAEGGPLNGEKKDAGGASGQAHIITEHKGGQSDAGVLIGDADGGKAKKTIEEVGGESSNPKLNKLRTYSRVKAAEGGPMNGEKKNAGGASGQAHIIVEHKGGQSDAGVVIGEADGGKAKEKIEVGGESSNPKLNKLRKDSRVKAAEVGPIKVATEREDTRKLLPKEKSSTKVKTMGMIFMCNSKTKDDCFRYQVLGLPASKRETVETIYKGMRLFLYDVDLKLLHGIYKAAAPGGYNIHPKAFNSQFPSQVQFTVLDDCEPLAEEKFKRVLKNNYYTKKFDTLLTSNQVKDLCKLFASSKHHGPRKLDSSHRRKAPVLSNRDEDLRPRRYQPYSLAYERAVIAPPVHVASRHRRRLSPRVAADLPYDRAVAIDGYRRAALVEHYDSYRRPLLKHRDTNRLAPLLEHHDVYWQQQRLLDHDDSYREDVVRHYELLRSMDEYRRPDPMISYRGVRYSGGDVGMHDPYKSYRESPGGLLREDDVMTEYRSVRPRYGYYRY